MQLSTLGEPQAILVTALDLDLAECDLSVIELERLIWIVELQVSCNKLVVAFRSQVQVYVLQV